MHLELLLLFVPFGFLFCVYFIALQQMKNYAVGEGFREDPGDLFNHSLALTIAIFFSLPFALLLLFVIPVVNIVTMSLLAAGSLGWPTLALIAIARRINNTRKNGPKIQMWMQDMYVVLIIFGLCMAVAFGFKSLTELEPQWVFICAFYFFSSQLLALMMALDVCRCSKKMQEAGPRIHFVGFVVFLSTFLLPFVFLAWCVWRRALRNRTEYSEENADKLNRRLKGLRDK